MGGSVNAVESTSWGIVSSSLTVKSMRVKVTPAPQNGGGTQSFTFTLRQGKDAASMADTAIACTISEDETDCSITTDVEVSSVSMVSVRSSASGTPVSVNATWVITVDSQVPGETFMMGTSLGNTLSATATQYMHVSGSGSSPAAAENNRWSPIPGAFTSSKLCVYLGREPGSGASRQISMSLNTSTNSQPTVTYSDTTRGILCDTTTSSATVAGNTYAMKSIPTGAVVASTATWGFIMTASNNGDFIIPSINSGVMSSTLNNYNTLVGIYASTTTADSTVPLGQTLTDDDYTITAAHARVSAAPGTGNSWFINLRESAADASEPFLITIAGNSATSGSASGTFTPSDGAYLNNIVIPDSNPTANTIAAISYLGHTASAVATNPGCLLLMGVSCP